MNQGSIINKRVVSSSSFLKGGALHFSFRQERPAINRTTYLGCEPPLFDARSLSSSRQDSVMHLWSIKTIHLLNYGMATLGRIKTGCRATWLEITLVRGVTMMSWWIVADSDIQSFGTNDPGNFLGKANQSGRLVGLFVSLEWNRRPCCFSLTTALTQAGLPQA